MWSWWHYCTRHLLVCWVLTQTFPVAGLQVPEPYGSAVIDYSAMNEYVKEHYGNIAGAEPYFPKNICDEYVYNGREGIIWDDRKVQRTASLQNCGFQLVSSPSDVQDWTDRKQLREIYLPELRNIFTKEFGTDAIEHLEFFHPMLRGEDLNMTTGHSEHDDNQLSTSPTASMAHIDNDIGAFEPERVVGLVKNNCINYENKADFPRQDILDAIRDGQRFLVVNCWRNAGTGPIRRAPLGIFATRYTKPNTCFPTAKLDLEQSRWYVFPEMTTEECLLFKQYDRDVRFPSDLWHCALHSLSQEKASLRRSLDVRALVVLKERVPSVFDRYSDERSRPILSYEESEKFCRAQGEARKGKTASSRYQRQEAIDET